MAPGTVVAGLSAVKARGCKIHRTDKVNMATKLTRTMARDSDMSTSDTKFDRKEPLLHRAINVKQNLREFLTRFLGGVFFLFALDGPVDPLRR
jgi:hypothetical protein